MQVNWKMLMARLLIWFVAEVYLSLLGIDNLADYSEFIFERDSTVLIG